jgi:hypothetical protein
MMSRSGWKLCATFLSSLLVCLAVAGPARAQQGTVRSFQKISDTQGNFLEPILTGDEMGGAVCDLGDLDGAGPSVRAIAVGATLDDDGGVNKGAVYIMFLGSNGAVLSYQTISDTQGNFLEPLLANDEFGASIANLGDLDGDGPSARAIAVGAIGDDDGGTDRGAVYILFLSTTGSVLSYKAITDTQGNLTPALHNLDGFGDCVATLGDLDRSGPSVMALAVGSSGDDDGGLDRGAIYILFLDATGAVLTSQKISDLAGTFTYPLLNEDFFGSSAAFLGDLDIVGPSAGALAVGAPGSDDGGSVGADRGALFVLFLSTTGNVLSYQKISDTQGNFLETLDNLDEFGGSLGAMRDLDGPGPSVKALAVGAGADDDGGLDRGAVYVLFLAANGTVLSSQKISDLAGTFTATIDDEDALGSSVCAIGDMDGAGNSMETLVIGASGDDDGGTDRGAVYVCRVNGNAGTVDVPARPGTVTDLLGATRPNPFRAETMIPFRITQAARVRIEILDVHGRLVRTLIDGTTTPGDHELAWDGTDDARNALAPGAYAIRMSVNGHMVEAARRTVLLR